MSLWNKILVALIAVAGLPLFFLAMATLKVHKYWAESAQKHNDALARVEKRIEESSAGVEQDGKLVKPGIRQLSLELNKLLLDRRRAWFNCDPKLIKLGRDDGTAEITVTVEQPSPHGIFGSDPKDARNKKTVLYAFDEIGVDKKGQYIGEFTATPVDGKQILLKPTARLNAREINRLDKLSKAKPRVAWTLYEMLPRDNRALFADLDAKTLKAILPAEVVSEYLKDGKPGEQDDPKDRIQGGKYVRQLRDYGVILGDDQRQRILLADSIENAKRDKQLIDQALAEARKQEEACKKDIAAATQNLKGSAGQRDVAAAYRKKLAEKLAAIEALVARLIETNRALAGQIAKFQLEAAERIDQRTRAMAQSGAERR
jgi:hypothetical protein